MVLERAMSTPANAFILSHPELGELPGRKLLDCLFALAPDGSILHLHAEQVEATSPGRLRLTGEPPAPDRARCCVIPPSVVELRAARGHS